MAILRIPSSTTRRELHCLLRRRKFEYNPMHVSQFKNSAKFGEIIKGLRVKYIFVSFLLPLWLLSSSSTAASGPPFTVGIYSSGGVLRWRLYWLGTLTHVLYFVLHHSFPYSLLLALIGFLLTNLEK